MSTLSPLQATLDAWFRRSAAAGLPGVSWGSLPCGVLAAAQLLIWIAAVLSIALVLVTKGEWARVPGGRIYWLLLGCLLLPGLISSFDALNLDKALSCGRLLAYGLIGSFCGWPRPKISGAARCCGYPDCLSCGVSMALCRSGAGLA